MRVSIKAEGRWEVLAFGIAFVQSLKHQEGFFSLEKIVLMVS